LLCWGEVKLDKYLTSLSFSRWVGGLQDATDIVRTSHTQNLVFAVVSQMLKSEFLIWERRKLV
jgi:hypothetical protein